MDITKYTLNVDWSKQSLQFRKIKKKHKIVRSKYKEGKLILKLKTIKQIMKDTYFGTIPNRQNKKI